MNVHFGVTISCGEAIGCRCSRVARMTADQIHQIGLDEVARIEREEAALARTLGSAEPSRLGSSLQSCYD